jgi:hypothetical protein
MRTEEMTLHQVACYICQWCRVARLLPRSANRSLHRQCLIMSDKQPYWTICKGYSPSSPDPS